MAIKVELKDRSYLITVKRGILSEIGPGLKVLGLKGKAAVVTNPTVGALYGERVVKGLKEAGFDAVTITIPDGEEYKTLNEAAAIYDGLIEHKMERGSPIIALGGGVIGDMAGFVAATYLRGVPYIQVPTTLLSQVDSSVGGKTGVNHEKGKNLIGAFYQPRAVFIDPDALCTLEPREVRAGLAEVIKYGVIWDKVFFEFLERNSGRLLSLGDEIIEAIERSCAIKAVIVGSDETEQGLRAILNYGHTFGHAIEVLSGYGSLRHGEAVAIGMRLAADFSVNKGLLSATDAGRVKDIIAACGLPVEAPAFPVDSWIASMKLDKKVSSGAIRLILSSALGEAVIEEAGEGELKGFFEALFARLTH